MEPKQTQIKKLVLTALFVAIATYGGSLFSFPIGIAKCAPVQSLGNFNPTEPAGNRDGLCFPG
ncbi:hypothetical protein ABNI15_05040 [Limosilactobacillus fermentum]|uniref:hypothetical protein n=1 Tax=Limosilactobacillus fermentum TaxID=1613 RepID=UPI0038D11DE7